ncbi:MAG: hypothetical protein A2Y70_01380 [Candidatus Aminicenantes bacterium RBG_13_64_14]|nr:MAG: hypothetical protein A2Y70_01380 [Candidatus Aminicenantes bacterium RBG_13_64_14]
MVLLRVAAELPQKDLVEGLSRRDVDLGELDAVGLVHDRPFEEFEGGEVEGLQAVAVDSDFEICHGPVRQPHFSSF